MDLLYSIGALLWSHGVWSFVGIAAWGVGFAVLGALIAVLAWSQRGRFLHIDAPADRWLHWVVLAGWIVAFVPTLGTAGVLLGTERAVIHVLEEERAVARVCSGAAAMMIEPALREAAAETGDEVALADLRVQTAALYRLREDGHAIVDRTLAEIAEEGAAGTEDEAAWVTEAKILVARTALEHFKDEALGEQDERLVELLADIETQQAEDGTVGVEDVSGVLASRWLEPPFFGVISSAFASARYPSYLTVLGLLALPFGLAALVRYVRRRRAAAPGQ